MNSIVQTRYILLSSFLLAIGLAALLVISNPDWWVDLHGWVRMKQIELRSELGGLTQQGESAALALIGLSFVYGVVHAVGPGHGKVIISTYAAATRATAKRVALLSFTASLVQALGAIVLVFGGIILFEMTARWATSTAETVLLPASYAAMAAVGIYLLWRGWCFWQEASHEEHHHHHHGHHDHDHDHHHHHAHDHDHAPPPEIVEAAKDWKAHLGIVLAIGIRPCTGAIVVLALAWGIGSAWMGVVAALAMGVGTGMTVALLAILTVFARDVAMKMVVFDTVAVGKLAGVCAMVGGAVISTFALALLWETLRQPVHPFLA